MLPFLLILMAGMPAGAAADETVAMVLEASSRVEIRRLADRDRMRAATGLRLGAGDSVFVPAGATITLLLRSGRVRQLASDYVLPGAGGDVQGLARTALQPVAAAREPAGYLRPLSGGPVPLSPRSGAVIPPGNVMLRWHAADGADGYTVHIRRTDVPGRLRFRAGRDTVWTPGTAMLEQGVTYEWSVTTADDGRPGSPETFTVIDSTAWQGILAELAEIEALDLPLPARLLLRALVYLRESMLHEAVRMFDELAQTGTPLSDEVIALYSNALIDIGDAESAATVRARETREGALR
jgi:hypothetical protein